MVNIFFQAEDGIRDLTVTGVQTCALPICKPKDNFTPGYELRAKVTVLAEGTRGSLTKKLVAAKRLDNINPQSYGIGIKEVWDVQPGRIAPGYVAHTLGWPVSDRKSVV